jgi:hypothetical protein
MGMEGMPQRSEEEKTAASKTVEEAKMERKAEEMMTPTERELSHDRVASLRHTAESALADIEDPVEFAKNIESASRLQNEALAKRWSAEAFNVPEDTVFEPEVYELKMKGLKKEIQSGTAVIKKGWKDSHREYFTAGARWSSSMDKESKPGFAAKIFNRVKFAAGILEQESKAGAARNQIREEVRQEILEAARREGEL